MCIRDSIKCLKTSLSVHKPTIIIKNTAKKNAKTNGTLNYFIKPSNARTAKNTIAPWEKLNVAEAL